MCKNHTYTPRPIDTTHIELPAELLALAEKLAENVHDEYALARIADGWSYGPERNDVLKTNPTIVPYNDLPDSEKIYDRRTALSTLKLILAMGWKITPAE